MAPKETLERVGSPVGAQSPVSELEIKRILCPMDFSDFSRRAFRYAVSLARHFGSRLLVQHTAQPASYTLLEGVGPPVTDADIQGQITRAREEMRQLLISTGVDSSEATILLNEGDAADRILETIARERVDLVVMGTHGHKGFSRLAVGSVTEQLIHLAVCPVLVVSRPEKDFVDIDRDERLKTIVLATDFSKPSDRALTYALKWAYEWRAKVVLFHSVERKVPAMKGLVDLFPEYNPYFERQVAGAWKKVPGLVPEEVKSRCEVVYEIRHGNPKEEILKVAQEKDADLIMTGARGAGNSGGPWGSVSAAVVRDGRYPVVVVRELIP
jgi:nucleotide-binding universal stress UspA family protein